MNNDQLKDQLEQRLDWKKNREKLEKNTEEEKTKNQVLQQQIAFYQDKLKTLQEDSQNNRSSYANFINKNLQVKKKEIEELTEQLNSLQNQIEVSPK